MKAWLYLAAILMSSSVYAAEDCCYDAGDPNNTPGVVDEDEHLWQWYDGDVSNSTYGKGNDGFVSDRYTMPVPHRFMASPYVFSGMTCDSFNAAAKLHWFNPGSDWVDANNTPQGTVPYVTHSISSVASPEPKNIPITNLALLLKDGITIRTNGAQTLTIASKDHLTEIYHPRLILTLSDNSVIEVKPKADQGLGLAGTRICDATLRGRLPTMTMAYAMVFGFDPLPQNIVSAIFRVTVMASSGNQSLMLFGTVKPRGWESTWSNRVFPINPNATVLYHEHFETNDWWTRAARIGGQPSDIRHEGAFSIPSSDGHWWADGSSNTITVKNTEGWATPQTMARKAGKIGRGITVIQHPFGSYDYRLPTPSPERDAAFAAGASYNTNPPGSPTTNPITSSQFQASPNNTFTNPKIENLQAMRGLPVVEPTELWLSYWIMFHDKFNHPFGCDGGKLPGLAGQVGPSTGLDGLCASSSTFGNGHCGWSARLSFSLICDPENPAYNRVNVYQYMYSPLQFQSMTGAGTNGKSPRVLLRRERWHCIEQHIKVNTPGVADGELHVFINGKMAIEIERQLAHIGHPTIPAGQDIPGAKLYLRGPKQLQGYGSWYYKHSAPLPTGRTVPQIQDPVTGANLWWYDGTYAGTANTFGTFTFKPGDDMGIHAAYIVWHNGGVKAWGHAEAAMTFDEIRISTDRMGCVQ